MNKYQVGDLVVYSNSGICRVTEIGLRPDLGDDPEQLYYTLTPLYRSEMIYTPVGGGVYMRPALGRKQVLDLIAQIPSIPELILENRSFKSSAETYQRALQSHDCRDLVQLIKTIYTKNQTAFRQKRNCSQIDQRYMTRAEDLLYGEFAAALDIPVDGVQQYISSAIGPMEPA